MAWKTRRRWAKQVAQTQLKIVTSARLNYNLTIKINALRLMMVPQVGFAHCSNIDDATFQMGPWPLAPKEKTPSRPARARRADGAESRH
jgi:hypothetical protein